MRRGLTAGLLTTCVFLLAGAQQALAATPTPPFSECPAIGLDTSCALLIYVTPTGQVGVAGDPTQGPFDGVEDTLIGVQNNSPTPLSSLPLSATSGKPLFGFDGDGLCLSFPSPPACPFDSTSYAGPGVSFSNISVDTTSGTVNFSPAVPPGGSAYFSLEEALSTVPPFDIAPGPPNGGLTAQQISSSANEPVVAVNPTDPKNVVVAFNHPTKDGSGNFLVHCGYEVTKDGGQTWSGPHDLAVPKAQGLTANAGGDPSLAFRADGKLFFACLASGDDVTSGASSQAPTELYSAVSGDGGSSFGPSVILVHGTDSVNTNGPDQEEVAAAPTGTAVYMCYTFYVSGTPAVRVAQLDAGTSPSIVNKASATAGTGQKNPQGCTVSVAASGRVWAGWWDSNAGATSDIHANRAYAAYSTDGANSFTGVTALGPKRGDDGTSGGAFHPERHVYVQASPAPGDGRVLAVWEDVFTGVDSILQAVNTGSGWGGASSIAAGTQPSVAWGLDGKVAYGYYSDLAPFGSMMDYQVAQTAGPAIGTLSGLAAPNASSSELSGLGPCCGRFGDYSGVAEENGTAYGVWTDNGNSSGNTQTVWLGHN
jgi:hypothetical protein